MLILLSSAKTMAGTSKIRVPECTVPQFLEEARFIALQMAQYDVNELQDILKVNRGIAAANYLRYQHFHAEEEGLQTILAYTGVVFRNLGLTGFSKDDFEYAQKHIRFGSSMYGLLRPFDRIQLYRMEYDVKLPEIGGGNMYSFWPDKLTDQLIADVKAAGGTLINLAASDVLPSFDWKRVKREVRVITPDFKVWKDGKIKAIVVYLKMARGNMTRYIIKNRLTDPEVLKGFIWEGFTFQEEMSDEDNWLYLQ
ncbi:MAG: YaaA family protein [Tannerellaceae bacterium]|nr:YaaA family protein [Tannerellaceae bacterium]